jgi:hypothetical protein
MDIASSLLKEVKDSEMLIGLFNIGLRDVAPVLSTQKDIETFHNLVLQRRFLTEAYYAVPCEKISETDLFG